MIDYLEFRQATAYIKHYASHLRTGRYFIKFVEFNGGVDDVHGHAAEKIQNIR